MDTSKHSRWITVVTSLFHSSTLNEVLCSATSVYISFMPLPLASVVRISIAAIWLLSPPVLVTLAVMHWRRGERRAGWKGLWPIVVASAVLMNWFLFLAFLFAGQIGGFGAHYMTTRLADWFLLLSLGVLIASLIAYVGRWQLSLASLLVLALWVGSEMVA